MTEETIYSNLKQLGGKTELPESPDKAELERVPNPQQGLGYCVRFTAPEFTSLCPMTGQPDFARLARVETRGVIVTSRSDVGPEH